MKLGVISDTHRHIVNFSKAVDFLQDRSVDKIIHLGDDYSDVDELGERGILRVPGVFSDAYQDAKIPNRMVENYGGWRFLLSHTVSSHPNDLPGDLVPEDLIRDKRVKVVLYGHSHMPDIKQEHGIIFFNPGHLKNEDKKGFPPTFGYIELTIADLLVRLYNLRDYSIFREEKFRK
ncbi:YfcE family phosphodiesterase [candidate division WOR-3 bacterium]|nr:YfcE family phosphodiesterase [candidate division WOR-3 bacterium]